MSRARTCADPGLEADPDLGYMAQVFSLYRQLPVRTNLQFYGRAYGLHGKRLRQRIDWALDEFHLRGREDNLAGNLPGGFRQRLAMAAALLHEPAILFLDEPTSGADPLARREFWLRISGFAQKGVTVIVTTHFMEEAEYCDRMLIMSRGEELAQGTPADIRRLAESDDNPEPTVEDAFIALAEDRIRPADFKRRPAMTPFTASLMRIRGLLGKEILQIRRDPSSILLAIVMPVVLLFLFGYGVSLNPTQVPVAIVNC